MKLSTSLLVITVMIISTSYLQAQNLDKFIGEADYTFYREDFKSALKQYEYIHHLYPEEESIGLKRWAL